MANGSYYASEGPNGRQIYRLPAAGGQEQITTEARVQLSLVAGSDAHLLAWDHDSWQH